MRNFCGLVENKLTQFEHWQHDTVIGRCFSDIESEWYREICQYYRPRQPIQLGGIPLQSSLPVRQAVVWDKMCHSNELRPDLVSCYRHLPLSDQSVDLVVMNHVVEQHADIRWIGQEASRVVVSGGMCVVYVLTPWHWRTPLASFRLRQRFPWCRHWCPHWKVVLNWAGYFDYAYHETVVLPLVGLNKVNLAMLRGRRYVPGQMALTKLVLRKVRSQRIISGFRVAIQEAYC